MARNFDGTNDRLATAADAVTGINVATAGMCAWVYVGSQPSAEDALLCTAQTATSPTNGVRGMRVILPTTSGYRFGFNQAATTRGEWASPDVTTGAWHSFVVVRNRATAANQPTMWVDGASVSVTEIVAQTGGATGGDDTVVLGEGPGGTNDFAGRLATAVIVAQSLTDADANRFHWWGSTPGGPSTMQFWLPLWTDSLQNAGTGGDFAVTATGTTVIDMPKIERCWASTMGCGR